MKIGIATFHWSQNYGALLQTYALKTRLTELGHEVYVIDKRPNRKKNESFSSKIKDAILRVMHPFDRGNEYKQKSKLEYFRNNYLSLVKEGDIPKLDAIVCGSDQIWNPKLTGGKYDPLYFGVSNQVDAQKRIAYAASIGEATIPENEIREFESLVSRMDAISVREKSIVDLVQKCTKNKVYNVVDPTLLLQRDDYSKLINDSTAWKQPYVLIYQNTYDENLYKMAFHIAKRKNLKVIEIARKRYRPISKCKVILDGGVEDFLNMYKNAAYVVTNTFHGTVFAIEFGREFVSIPLKGRESRVETLSEITGLQDRLLSGYSENSFDEILTKEIDYNDVYERLARCRQSSEDFLTQALD